MNGSTFEMHNLIQLATREWLKVNQEHERWKEQFITNLNAELPTGEYENWATCQALFPHAQAALAQKPENQELQKQWATVPHRAARYAWQMGRGAEVEKLLVQAWKTRRKGLGGEHEDTMDSMAMVGLVYKLRGRWDAAEANLAFTWEKKGQRVQAMSLLEACIQSQQRILGSHHVHTLSSRSAPAAWREDAKEDECTDMNRKEEVEMIGEDQAPSLSGFSTAE